MFGNDNLNESVCYLSRDKLIELLDTNRLLDENDKEIARLIIQSETDWRIEFQNLNDFLNVLEKEIGGETTKANLEELLKKYNRQIERFAWEAESITSLLETFNFSNEITLKKIMFSLFDRVNHL